VVKLFVNRETGAMTLQNNTGSPLRITGYSILSPDGALDENNWTPIANNYDEGNGGPIDTDDSWTVLTADGATDNLSEAQFGGNPSDGGVLANGTLYNLGNAWFQNLSEDLSMELLLEDGEK